MRNNFKLQFQKKFSSIYERFKYFLKPTQIDFNNENSFNKHFLTIDTHTIYYLFLIGLFLIIFSLCENWNNIIVSEFNAGIVIQFLLIFLYSLVIIAFFVFKRKRYTCDIFKFIIFLILDVYTLYLSYDTKNGNYNIRFIVFKDYMRISIFLLFLFKLNFSFSLLCTLLSFKLIIFIISFSLTTNIPNKIEKNYFEIFIFVFYCVIIIFLNHFKRDFLKKAYDFFIKNKFSNDYVNSLINSLERSFVSINFSKYSINSNNSFINFLKNLGIEEYNLICFEKENNKLNKENLKNTSNNINNFCLLNNKYSKNQNMNDNSNFSFKFCKKNELKKNKNVNKIINCSDRMILKRNSEEIESKLNLKNKDYFNKELILEEKLNLSYTEKINKNDNFNNFFDLNINEEKITEEVKNKFEVKLNFLLDEIFSNFHLEESGNNIANGKDKIKHNQNLKIRNSKMVDIPTKFQNLILPKSNLIRNKKLKESLSDILKKNFSCNENDETKKLFNHYEYASKIVKTQEFNSKDDNTNKNLFQIIGTFISNKKYLINNDKKHFHEKIDNKLNKEKYENVVIEVYVRKIETINGKLCEFFINDITSTRTVEIDKAQNTLKANILAKVSHEFKTPLITIIYILKNYIKKSQIRKSFLSNNLNSNLKNLISNNQNSSSLLKMKTTMKFNEYEQTEDELYLNQNNIKINKNKVSNSEIENENFEDISIKPSIEDEDYIENTIDLSDYMLSLINDIVDFSAINSDYDIKCNFEKFELHELLIFSFRILKILINCRGMKNYINPILDISDNVPINFCSDEKRLKQILLNLITNSIKFTRRGYIKISAKLISDNSLSISVEDTGIGIQEKDIGKLFKDHSKIDDKENAELNKIGSGLGLSICKRIAEKIGKKIQVESIPNKKTKFYFIVENKNEYRKSFSANRNNFSYNSNLRRSLNLTSKSWKSQKTVNENSDLKNYKKCFSRMNSWHTNLAIDANLNLFNKIKIINKNKYQGNLKNTYLRINNKYNNDISNDLDIERNNLFMTTLPKFQLTKNLENKDSHNLIGFSLIKENNNEKKFDSNYFNKCSPTQTNNKDISILNSNLTNTNNMKYAFSNNKSFFNHTNSKMPYLLDSNTNRNDINFNNNNLFNDDWKNSILKFSNLDCSNQININKSIKKKDLSSNLYNIIEDSDIRDSDEQETIRLSEKEGNQDSYFFPYRRLKMKNKQFSQNFEVNNTDETLTELSSLNLLINQDFINMSNDGLNIYYHPQKDIDNKNFSHSKTFDVKNKNLIFHQKTEDLNNNLFKNTNNKNTNTPGYTISHNFNSNRNDNNFNENETKFYESNLIESNINKSSNSCRNCSFYENIIFNMHKGNSSETINKFKSESNFVSKLNSLQRNSVTYKENINKKNSNVMNNEFTKNSLTFNYDNICDKMYLNSKLNSSINDNELLMEKELFDLIKPIKRFYDDSKENDIILVVDDNKFLQKSMKNNIRTILSDKKIRVIGCLDGIETIYLVMLDQITGNKIKLIISDENMVYMNGSESFSILERFHKDAKIAKISLAICSAARNSNQNNYGDEIFEHVLNKPASKNELKRLFNNIGLI